MPLPGDEQKWMSARAFARGLSDALDEVQFDGRTIQISRHGRLAAMLIPPPSAGDDAPPRMDAGPEEPDIELTELEGLVVDAVARHPHRWWHPDASISITRGDVVTLLRAVAWLELKGVSKRDHAGYWLTPAGRRLARVRGAQSE